MTDNLEFIILKNLFADDEYLRKVVPFIKPSYFSEDCQIIYKQFIRHMSKYNKAPTEQMFSVEIDQSDISGAKYETIKEIIPHLYTKTDEVDKTWLLENTEKWCQDRAIYNAIMESINIIDGKNKKLTVNALPDILQKALSVSFDRNVGHDYIEDFQKRFDFYHTPENKIPFEIELLNTITNGGLSDKTLNIILAGTGVGKSLAMCAFASSWLIQGYNVLYITAEMSEEKIGERIDANLFDIPISEMENIPQETFSSRINKIKKKTNGKLIIKEYPTASANVNHFRALLNELNLKKSFKPDIIVIDYLNICASSRMKTMGGAINSYSYIKAIAEEIRGLAVEFDVPILSATQTTRSGYSNSDPGLEDTSESFGLPATADLMLALVSSEELEEQNLIMVKQLKNRYADVNFHRRFTVGINRSKMKMFDAEDADDLIETEPVFDKTEINERFKDFKL